MATRCQRKFSDLGPILLLLCVIATGCGSSVKTYPVSGKIEVEGGGSPKQGTVIFSNDKGTAQGIIQSDGSFKLTTDKPDDGAPEGTYKVIVMGTVPLDYKNPDNKPLVDKKFEALETTTLSVKIEPKENSVTLKVTPPTGK